MRYFTLLATASAASLSDIPSWVNRCRQQPDGTMLPDPTNPQGYVECQDNQPVSVDCPDELYWDQHFLECQPQKACRPPPNWSGLHYSYQDGIYYHTWVQTGDYSIFQARLLCPVLGGKDAMPYNQSEYEAMMEEQQNAIDAYLVSDECVNNSNPDFCEPNNSNIGDYMFYMGIDSFIRDKSFTYANYYYYDSDRTGSTIDYKTYGAPFTMEQWWLPGYPTNQSPNPKNNFEHLAEKHVAQVGNQGLINFDGNYRLDGVNCMYVCPGY